MWPPPALLLTLVVVCTFADDLALRHAASQALGRFIEGAAAATGAAGRAAGSADGLLAATQKVLFPQLKHGLPSPNLAVRQVRGAEHGDG